MAAAPSSDRLLLETDVRLEDPLEELALAGEVPLPGVEPLDRPVDRRDARRRGLPPHREVRLRLLEGAAQPPDLAVERLDLAGALRARAGDGAGDLLGEERLELGGDRVDRSPGARGVGGEQLADPPADRQRGPGRVLPGARPRLAQPALREEDLDRKSTRLNSSHLGISY